ncbi:ABC transporter ATP-binding protein [uncultured Propionibacterium sp.]|uniref:ABC transporter ATP-binding protein n=1 Tax=uncultured Propionibacterium sp. TaxID=218066 RepID=UPI00292F54E9|nr:ABC transporter ATP-binding protein [uncultured Propionibacterium sp.]
MSAAPRGGPGDPGAVPQRAPGTGAGLSVRGLAMRYPHGDPVIEQLTVDIAPGAFTVILGPNACGKSTLLRALSRVLAPSGGQVLLDGRDVHSYSPKALARRVGFLAQSSLTPDGITVRELVARGRYPHQGLLRPWSIEDERQVRAAMERTHVAGLAARPVANLSGGQRQRVWIAMALAQQTDILLLDEPTTYLDLAHQVDVLELCRELNQGLGTTIVAVLHDLNQACRYADEVIAMRDGAILASGAPSDVVTPELVEQAYGLPVGVFTDPITGTPLVLPRAPGDGP